MRTLRATLRRMMGLFMRRRQDAEFAAELDSHLALHIDDGIRSGLTAAEARRQALIKLGGIEPVRESYRDRAGIPLVEGLLQDMRYGFRRLRKEPRFTCVAILTLALGVGANTAVFSVVNAVLLRPLPFPKPGQIVRIARQIENSSVNMAEYRFGAFLLTRSLQSLLFGVRPNDPVIFAAVSVSLLCTGLLASYISARRATKVDPMTALRWE